MHTLLVIARCTACRLVASRFLDDSEMSLAAIVGAEALAALGCPHVEAVTLTQRKTLA